MLQRNASGLGATALLSRIENMREAYSFMTRYALQGIDDPSRPDLYDDLTAAIRDTAAEISRARKIPDNPSLYFSTLRNQALDPEETIASLIQRYIDLTRQQADAAMFGEKEGNDAALPTGIDAQERRMFNRVWTTHPLSSDDFNAITSFLENPAIGSEARQLLIAAIMMGELEWHDDRRLLLLVNAYLGADNAVSIKALIALMLALWTHRRRPMRRKVANAVAAAFDSPERLKDVRMAFLQIIRTRDTERVNRKIRDQIIPDLIKMRPDIEKRFRNMPTEIDPEALEENPEWEEILDKTGMKDKLKELSELQEQGADVMMGTFGNLKQFPFFNDIHHWFVPFSASHPSIDPEMRRSGIADIIEQAHFLCDNDKFSLACAFSMMPPAQRDMVVNQFKMQNADMDAVRAASLLTADTDRAEAANKWVQSLYRFFKLFRRKSEFADIFATPLNPIETPLLKRAFDEGDTLSVASEFYFKREFFEEAYSLFSHIAAHTPVTIPLLQKMGYCRQRLADIEGAIAHYEHAELLNDSSLWTARRLGACHRMAGNHAAALPYMQRVADERPDDLNAALALANCLVENGRLDEAIALYYKVEFHQPDNRKVWAPLAWSLMLTGKLDKARQYMARLLEDNPSATDFLNAAHLDLLSGNFADALARYQLALNALEGNEERFTAMVNADAPHILKCGADPLVMKIIIDNAISK